MSAHAPLYAQVYIHHAENRSYERIGLNIDRNKLMAFSIVARKQLSDRGNIHAKLPFDGRHSVVFEARTVDVPAAKAICKWIQGNDERDPKPLTRHHAVSETFPDLVKLYFTGYRFHLRRDWRGTHIHDDLIWYFKAAPLRFDEFVMVMEYCGFDASICNAMMNDVMFRRVKGMTNPARERRARCPDEADILEWARAAGVSMHMEAIEEAIRKKFEERNAPGIW